LARLLERRKQLEVLPLLVQWGRVPALPVLGGAARAHLARCQGCPVGSRIPAKRHGYFSNSLVIFEDHLFLGAVGNVGDHRSERNYSYPQAVASQDRIRQ
jgi:hypothetical protein